jgi:hypothetical protein
MDHLLKSTGRFSRVFGSYECSVSLALELVVAIQPEDAFAARVAFAR